jgi:starvation-inducible outer membrane lipoprotein
MKKFMFLGMILFLLGGCATIPNVYIDLRDRIEEMSVKQLKQESLLKTIIEVQQLIIQEITKLIDPDIKI